MVHRINDHAPPPITMTGVLSDEQFSELKEMLRPDPSVALVPVLPSALNDEQFTKLVALLTPSYELSTFVLAQYKAQGTPSALVAEPGAPVDQVGQPMPNITPDPLTDEPAAAQDADVASADVHPPAYAGAPEDKTFSEAIPSV